MSNLPPVQPAEEARGSPFAWVVALCLLLAVMAGLRAYASGGLGAQQTPPPIPPPAADYPVRGVWRMATNHGQLIIMYRETPSAAGKMYVRLDLEEGVFVIENLLDSQIAIAPIYRLTYRDGIVEHIGQASDVAIMAPKQKTGGRLDAFADSEYSLLEFWYLVTS